MKRILIFVMFFLAIVTGLNADTKDKFDNVETPENVMLSFEDAINNKDYERAWNYWSSAPSDNYEKWKKGYAGTKNISLYYKLKDTDAGAGNRWVTYSVRMFSVDTKGKKHLYEGEYTLHSTNPDLYDSKNMWPGWKIEKGQFKKIY